MSQDKIICNKSDLTSVADTIRSKLGVTDTYHVSELSDAIDRIPTGKLCSWYGTCSTDASTAEKEVTCDGFTLETGAKITVKFTVTNTASSPTLNVNGTGAKSIYYRNAAITASVLATNRIYEFVYDGSHYELVGDISVVSRVNGATIPGKAIYAPTSSGSRGQVLKSNGSGSAPTWTSGHLVTGVADVATSSYWEGSSILGEITINGTTYKPNCLIDLAQYDFTSDGGIAHLNADLTHIGTLFTRPVIQFIGTMTNPTAETTSGITFPSYSTIIGLNISAGEPSSTSTYGYVLLQGSYLTFVSCQFSSHLGYTDFSCVPLVNCVYSRFINCDFVNSFSSALRISSDSHNVSFDDCRFRSNTYPDSTHPGDVEIIAGSNALSAAFVLANFNGCIFWGNRGGGTSYTNFCIYSSMNSTTYVIVNVTNCWNKKKASLVSSDDVTNKIVSFITPGAIERSQLVPAFFQTHGFTVTQTGAQTIDGDPYILFQISGTGFDSRLLLPSHCGFRIWHSSIPTDINYVANADNVQKVSNMVFAVKDDSGNYFAYTLKNSGSISFDGEGSMENGFAISVPMNKFSFKTASTFTTS